MGSAASGLVTWFFNVVTTPAQWGMTLITSAGGLRYLWGTQWAQIAIAAIQGVAFAVLALRATQDALMMASLRAQGGPTDIGGLVKRVVASVIAILLGPTVAVQMLYIGNDLAQMVAHFGLATALPANMTAQDTGAQVAFSTVFSVLVLVVGLVLVLVCLAQSMIRSIEMLLAALVSPLLAVGFMSDNGGTASAWFSETLILACTQAVQVLVLYIAVTMLVSPGAVSGIGQALLRPFFFVAACWVAVRTPHILKQYVFHSGTGSGLTGLATRAASKFIG